MPQRRRTDVFTRFTSAVSEAIGRPWVFVIALIILLLWGVSGPLLGFSDTWQLIINTGTTIVTFLMVFIIQNTQNRDQLASNIKLDAIMKKLDITGKDLLTAEEDSDVDLEQEKRKMEQGHKRSTQSHGRPKQRRHS
ncbi:MAG TPA: low affinity iron permease family protein [Candidatus Saccharimonadales bacterium]|nr:low affinity iron permease family protein [Candidatus Saccharimonadales bacterium]